MDKNIRGADPRTRAPETYTAPKRIAAEDEVADFIAALVRLVKPRRVLEVGTAYGHTSAKIGTALQANGFGELDTIDGNKSRSEEAKRRCHGLPVNVIVSDFRKVTLPEETVYDLAFFDADRRRRDVEYQTFKPYLSDTAVLLFHDAGLHHEVAQAGLGRLPLNLTYLPCPRGLLIASET